MKMKKEYELPIIKKQQVILEQIIAVSVNTTPTAGNVTEEWEGEDSWDNFTIDF